VGYARALETPGVEVDQVVEPLEGSPPVDLRGTLYRNGAGLRRTPYLIDGEGLVSAVSFRPGMLPRVRSRFVDTVSYRAARDHSVQPLRTAGSNRPGGWWRNLGASIANQANTNVVRLGDRVFALWEGGHPHELDPESLATRGQADFDGSLKTPFSAHPCWDDRTKELFNFGVSLGVRTKLTTMRIAQDGRVNVISETFLPRPYMVHAFALTARYLVFCLSPVWFRRLALVSGSKPPFDALEWKPSEGTRILLIPRAGGPIKTFETDSWYQWHFAGAFDAGDNVVVDLVRFRSWTTIHEALGPDQLDDPQHIPIGRLCRVRIQPTGRVELETLHPLSVEWPTVDPRRQTGGYRRIFAAAQPSTTPAPWWFTAIASYDIKARRMAICDYGSGGVISEPIFARRAGGDPSRDDDGYLVYYRTRADGSATEILISNAADIEAGPVFRGVIPGTLGTTFHGAWWAA
jgi:all-trans-8'-apo-beta-carotenal 15,15'-oxygenase